MTLAGLGCRGSRTTLLFLLVEELGDKSRQRGQKGPYLLENLHLGPYPDNVFAFIGLGLSHTVTNATLDHLLDLPLDETSRDRSQSLVQEIVLRAPNRGPERSDPGVGGFDLERRRMVIGRYELDRHVNAPTTEGETGEARVSELGNTGLLPEVEGDIRLDLAEAESDTVFGLVVDNTVRRELEMVPGRHGDNVGEQVLAGEGEVEGIVGASAKPSDCCGAMRAIAIT